MPAVALALQPGAKARRCRALRCRHEAGRRRTTARRHPRSARGARRREHAPDVRRALQAGHAHGDARRGGRCRRVRERHALRRAGRLGDGREGARAHPLLARRLLRVSLARRSARRRADPDSDGRRDPRRAARCSTRATACRVRSSRRARDSRSRATELAALGQPIGKTEQAVLELAAAGFTVRRILDVIPENDAAIRSAISALLDRGIIRLV